MSDGNETAREVPVLALRPKDAARALGIGESLLWTHTNCGTIPHVKIGTAVLYPVAVLERWLTEQATGGKESRDKG
jgi:predicted DNA-binding transcriptional regulator AlpA